MQHMWYLFTPTNNYHVSQNRHICHSRLRYVSPIRWKVMHVILDIQGLVDSFSSLLTSTWVFET